MTFGAGVDWTLLIATVEKQGFALENIPSLPHINVIGSILTGTHGSGFNYPIHAKHVHEIEIIHGDGKLAKYTSSNTPNFERYLINLGSLGVVVSMSMALVPSYMVNKSKYEKVSWD